MSERKRAREEREREDKGSSITCTRAKGERERERDRKSEGEREREGERQRGTMYNLYKSKGVFVATGYIADFFRVQSCDECGGIAIFQTHSTHALHPELPL